MISPSEDVTHKRAMRRLGTPLLGRYTITRLIGLGGMAAVYAGFHRNGHEVAIKILHDRLSADPEIERLFRREAQLSNRVGHPGVVPVIDDDVTEDGCVFLVMPLLQGETARARAERMGGKLPIAEAVQIAHAVLQTLAAAHSKSIVHRDVKPENIFIAQNGDVKVLDFGIGRFFESNEAATVTRTARAVGTPAFMAPEQALGRVRDVDGRTDLWAVGATLFTLLSGRFVHEAETASEAAALAATRVARKLVEVAPGVPEALRAVVDRALEFEKGARWADGASFARALEAAWTACSGGRVSEIEAIVPAVATPAEWADLPTEVPLSMRATEAVEGQATTGAGGALTAAQVSASGLLAGLRAGTVVGDGASGSAKGDAAAGSTAAEVVARPAAEVASSRTGARSRRVWGGLGAAVVVVTTVAVEGYRVAHLRSATGAAASVASAAVAAPLADGEDGDLAALLHPELYPVEAVQHYREGIAHWRNAARHWAISSFSIAAQEAPALAAADLWFVFSTQAMGGTTRTRYHSAQLHRDSLNRTQAEALDALLPSVDDPPNDAATAARLKELSENHPGDTLLALVTASEYSRLDNRSPGREIVERLKRQESRPARLWFEAATLAGIENQSDEFISAIGACVSASAESDDCISLKFMAETDLGQCDSLQTTCRTLAARAPDTRNTYTCLANSAYSHGGTLEQIRTIMLKRRSIIEGSTTTTLSAEEEMHLAIIDGRLSDARRYAATWATDAVNERNEDDLRDASSIRVWLAREEHLAADAERAAEDYDRDNAIVAQSTLDAPESVSIYLHSLAGTANATGRDRFRARAMAKPPEDLSSLAFTRWYNTFLLTSWTSTEAENALAKEPRFRPWRDFEDADQLYFNGLVGRLAGNKTVAQRYFERAARSCDLEQDFFRTKALLETAIDDANGDSCKQLGSVLHHWRKSPTSATMVAAAQRARQLSCPSRLEQP